MAYRVFQQPEAEASVTGLAASFFIVGGVLLGALTVIAIYIARRPYIVRE